MRFLFTYLYIFVNTFIQVMTNLNKLYQYYNVHSHKEQEIVRDLLKNHLPNEYTAQVISKLLEQGIAVSSQTIRNVKSGVVKNFRVFNAIIELSKEYKEFSDRLKENLKTTV